MRNYTLDKFADLHVHMSDLDFGVCEDYLNLLAEQNVTDVALQSLTYRDICYNLSVLYWKYTFKKLNLSAFGMIHSMPNDIYELVRQGISHDKTEFKMPAYRDYPIKGLDLPTEVLEKSAGTTTKN